MRDDIVILSDYEGNEIGISDKNECHRGRGILHKAFSIHIFNSRGEVLIQKRSSRKMLWPLFWSNSCCSHPRPGEPLQTAAQRRLHEELGISSVLAKAYTFSYNASYSNIGAEREICDVLIGNHDGQINPNKNEVDEYRWISPKMLLSEITEKKMSFTPWSLLEFPRLLQASDPSLIHQRIIRSK